MAQFKGYPCSLCKTEYEPVSILYTCPKCGGNLDVILDYEKINNRFQKDDLIVRSEDSLWKYLPLLPVCDPGGIGTPFRFAGWTPLYHPPGIKKLLGLNQLWIKDEGKNPTASFKDRASAIVVARAREIKAEDCSYRLHRQCRGSLGWYVRGDGSKMYYFCSQNCSTCKSCPTADLWCSGYPGGWKLRFSL